MHMVGRLRTPPASPRQGKGTAQGTALLSRMQGGRGGQRGGGSPERLAVGNLT